MEPVSPDQRVVNQLRQHLDIDPNEQTANPGPYPDEDTETLQEEYDAEGRMVSLTIHGADLRPIPPEIWELTSLRNLNLSRTHIDCLPAEIGQLTHLQRLELVGNHLSSLPAEIGQLTQLTWLDLSTNQLDSLPDELGHLVNLTGLFLSFNHLSSLPAEIGQLAQLRCLYVAWNLLSSLPVELALLPNLGALSVDHNPLLEMPPPDVLWHGLEAIRAYLRERQDAKPSVGKLETERLVLRHLYPKDAPALLEMLSHDEMRQYDNVPSLSSLAEARDLVEQAHTMFTHRRGMRLGIMRKDTGQLIGVCGYVWDQENALAVLHGELACAYWGQGIMTEALQALIQFGFTEKQIHRMECQVVVEHAASVRLFHKLGFQEEGILRERLFINGQYRDMLSLALLRQDFSQTEKHQE